MRAIGRHRYWCLIVLLSFHGALVAVWGHGGLERGRGLRSHPCFHHGVQRTNILMILVPMDGIHVADMVN